jgi:hypothetical protein
MNEMTMTVSKQATVSPVVGLTEMAGGIDEVIAAASNRIAIFDRDLADGGYNAPERFNRLKVFLLASRRNRLDIAVHQSEYLERDCPRMTILLRQFPYAVRIHRTLPEAQRVQDAFVIADGQHYLRRFHRDHPRAEKALYDESGAGLLQRRFEEIWIYSEPALSATLLGL